MNYDKIKAWLEVSRDEITTLIEYTDKLERIEDVAKLKEIMGDEVNHALIALLTASTLLGLKVPEDGLQAAMEAAFPEVEVPDDEH